MPMLRLIRVVIVILLLVGSVSHVAVAQDEPTAPTEQVAVTTASEAAHLDAFVAKDLDALMAVFADDAVFVDPTFGDRLEGAASVRGMQRDVMRLTDTDASEVLEHFVSADGSRAVQVWRWAGTNYLGSPFDMPILVLHEYRDGKIARETIYYAADDAYEQLTQPPATE